MRRFFPNVTFSDAILSASVKIDFQGTGRYALLGASSTRNRISLILASQGPQPSLGPPYRMRLTHYGRRTSRSTQPKALAGPMPFFKSCLSASESATHNMPSKVAVRSFPAAPALRK
jgi:hypothetical protein